jgi:selenocysteine lyase/cysteine desulfurase
VHLFGVREAIAAGRKVRVIIGPYEHHSNILPWRECGAEIVELAESAAGGPELTQLDAALQAGEGALVICALSAASNVTGIVADVAQVTRRVKAAGAKMLWDYAGGAPYLPMQMSPAADAAIDAIVFSPHKFIGGPGASGVLIVRRATRCWTPSRPGRAAARSVSCRPSDMTTAAAWKRARKRARRTWWAIFALRWCCW